MAEREFVGHAECPKCGSKDNLAVYSDGSTWCYGITCNHRENVNLEEVTLTRKAGKSDWLLPEWEYKFLKARALDLETCERFRYGVGIHRGEKVQVANYVTDGAIVAQKIRKANKDFFVLGPERKKMPLFGQHMWREGGKYLTITEGEIDAMSLSQVFDHKWPVVSVPNGAAGALQSITQQLDWVLSFKTIVLMFDMDEAGKAAAEQVAKALPPGKVKIASLPMKDANDMVKNQKAGELIAAFWGAKEFRPDGIRRVADIKENVLAPITTGVPWPWQELTDTTFGMRPREIYGIGAGTGVGKSDLVGEILAHLLGLQHKCGVFSLEMGNEELVRRTAGKMHSKLFHLPLPYGDYEPEELAAAINALAESDLLHFYDHWGVTEWDTIAEKLRYWATAYGIKFFFLDNLTALTAAADDERREVERIMSEMAGLAQELEVTIIYVSHLATPEGKPHEEGGRVMVRHFKGSRAIGAWSHLLLGLERNQQDPTGLTTLRGLKDRMSGRSLGLTLEFAYHRDTGRLLLSNGSDGGAWTDEGTEDFG